MAERRTVTVTFEVVGPDEDDSLNPDEPQPRITETWVDLPTIYIESIEPVKE